MRIERWSINCPYCNAPYASGNGYLVDDRSKIGIPYFRCRYCNGLIITYQREYLTLPVENRTKIEASNEEIEASIDRTNNSEYINFLKSREYTIYPLTEKDFSAHPQIDFENLKNKPTSKKSTDILFNSGILIKEEERNPETGGYKEECLLKNQSTYNENLKINKISCIVGLILAFFSSIFILYITGDGDSLLPLVLGVIIGILGGFLTHECIKKKYESNQSNKDDTNKKDN